jgi:hypothetical protein
MAVDTPEMIIIVLSAFTAAVWLHSWILDGRDDRANQPEARTAPLYHGEAMLGMEELAG